MDTLLGRESWSRSFQVLGNPLNWWVCGEFGISESNITGRETHTQTHTDTHTHTHTQNTCLTTTPSREVAQTLLSAISERGLDREVGAASLG